MVEKTDRFQGSGTDAPLRLADGSRVGIIGGGPAGAFFGYFLLAMAGQASLRLAVDIYEPRDFGVPGPPGCNMCGGVISESLVRLLAADGIILPMAVVQRTLDSYILHTDVGSVRIDPVLQGKRIAAVHRGSGPKGDFERRWKSFDAHILALAEKKGASVIRERVEGVAREDGFPRLRTRSGSSGRYDLVAVAAGVNGTAPRMFEDLGIGYRPPRTTSTYICEFFLGQQTIGLYLSNAMHVFLLNIPRVEFAALIPKGEYVTVCLLGEGIDEATVGAFLARPEVRDCFPPDWAPPGDRCRCRPNINIRGTETPFADRFVFVGDAAVNRLYKDGIGGAYRMAKAAARTAVEDGVSADAFRRGYLPSCQALERDNDIGRIIFGITRFIQSSRSARRGLVRLTAEEQAQRGGAPRRMSDVLWDTFTGSAPYKDVIRRTLHPVLLGRMAAATVRGLFGRATGDRRGFGRRSD